MAATGTMPEPIISVDDMDIDQYSIVMNEELRKINETNPEAASAIRAAVTYTNKLVGMSNHDRNESDDKTKEAIGLVVENMRKMFEDKHEEMLANIKTDMEKYPQTIITDVLGATIHDLVIQVQELNDQNQEIAE